MRKSFSQAVYMLIITITLSNSTFLAKGASDAEIPKINEGIIYYYFSFIPDLFFMKEYKTNIFFKEKLQQKKITKKADEEVDYRNNLIPDSGLMEFKNIFSLLQKGSKCICEIKNGKCACDGHKRNITDIAKTNSNAVKLIFPQVDMKTTNLRKLGRY